MGDRVLASCGFGGFAEAVVVKAEQALPIPDGLDPATAATVIQSYATGLFALERRALLQEGESLLVLGAGGGVGLAAVDLGRALGAAGDRGGLVGGQAGRRPRGRGRSRHRLHDRGPQGPGP